MTRQEKVLQWLKDHTMQIIGNFLIFFAPLVTLIALSYGRVEKIKYLNIVGILGSICFLIFYYKKLKQMIRDKMLIHNIKNQKNWFWQIMRFICFGLYFLIFYLLYDFIKGNVNQIMAFMKIFFVEGAVGYAFLIMDGFGIKYEDMTPEEKKEFVEILKQQRETKEKLKAEKKRIKEEKKAKKEQGE